MSPQIFKTILMQVPEHTLNNKARCLQSPTVRLPIGSTMDPKQFLRSSVQSFQIITKSSSPFEAASLGKEKELNYNKNRTENEFKLHIEGANAHPITLQTSFAR